MSGDVFEEMSAAVEPRLGKDGTVKRAGQLWCSAPAVNSLEMCIHAARLCDETFSHEVEFVEIEIEGEYSEPRAAPSASPRLQTKHIAMWSHGFYFPTGFFIVAKPTPQSIQTRIDRAIRAAVM